MKKLFALLLALCMVFTMAACGSNEPTETAAPTVAETEPAPTEEPVTEPILETEPLQEEVEVTLEYLQELFAMEIETDGMSAADLLAEGQKYEKGDGVVQWYAKAMAYYEAAKEAGHADAQAAIDALNAYKAEMVSEENSPNGQGMIFDFFRTGMMAGQKGDYETAYCVYYDDSFFFGDPVYRGLGSIGDLLLEGNGIEKDLDKAIMIFRFNAEVLGKGNGYTSLGKLYEAETGTYEGIEHSDEKALEYFVLSYKGENLKEGDFKGPRYAADMYDAGYTLDDGTTVAPDYVKAEEGYLAAAAGNGRTYDGTACYKLGTYYEEGREGIAQDYTKAVEYYILAVSEKNTHNTMLGIPQTYLALGRLYENGLGIAADLTVAKEYYQKALVAAEENLALENVAGHAAAQSVYDEASAALTRLG